MILKSFLILNYSKGYHVMNEHYSLNEIAPGERAVICSLQSTGSMRRRLLDIGLIKDTEVECLGRSPGGDPSAYLIRGAVIAIRSEDCKDILISTPSEVV
jgi:ferrous iron transport protein A